MQRGRRQGFGRRQRIARQAAVQLHSADHHGHTAVAAQEAHPERHLRIHHVPVPVLSGQVSRLAELHQAQPVAQRLLHKDTPGTGKPGKGQLLDPGPDGRGHVRQRQFSAQTKAIQANAGPLGLFHPSRRPPPSTPSAPSPSPSAPQPFRRGRRSVLGVAPPPSLPLPSSRTAAAAEPSFAGPGTAPAGIAVTATFAAAADRVRAPHATLTVTGRRAGAHNVRSEPAAQRASGRRRSGRGCGRGLQTATACAASAGDAPARQSHSAVVRDHRGGRRRSVGGQTAVHRVQHRFHHGQEVVARTAVKRVAGPTGWPSPVAAARARRRRRRRRRSQRTPPSPRRRGRLAAAVGQTEFRFGVHAAPADHVGQVMIRQPPRSCVTRRMIIVIMYNICLLRILYFVSLCGGVGAERLWCQQLVRGK